ncbi:lysosomal alpha-glucosidase-like [Anthonomus grandis grandis]|uniref:lysosomal alpha-glucosidase-like n=1 Tax=Anthonomus grandis grandis TaxID=2921223 RepID=UPI00216574BB|nr:lysosomal alpha-glucosidase-like [Anthonomus grandis grandis]XP_050301022.1 lysosomal alpha-glucosidase-like [Anthonomus grandis grandis]
MRFRNFISSFRTRRARRPLTDSVSFENFCNETATGRCTAPKLKESSLNSSFEISPAKIDAYNYKRFAREPETLEIEGTSSRPNLATILLFIILSAVFLILPIIYLLNCFDIIYEHHNLKHNPIVQPNGERYYPSEELHKLLNDIQKEHQRKIALPSPPKPDYGECKLLKDDEKFDCYPEEGANQDGCEARGCCWIPAKTKPKRYKSIALDVPYCYYPPNYETYKFLNVTQTAFGLVGFLKRNYKSAYPNDVEIIKLIVKYETENRLHLKIVDPINPRYEPSYPEVPLVDRAAQNLNYIFEIDTFKPGFKVVRKTDNVVIFDSNNFLNFIYSNQFLQISSKLPSKYIYGIGDHTSNLLLNTQWNRFTLWNHDLPPMPDKNLYGSHPFYLMIENSTSSHGVFLLNSNAMDVILQPTPAITFRTIGGIIDLYFFMGPTPSDVIDQYTDLIGRPYMPPYWSLGYHLCRFGYKSLNQTKEIMENNLKAGIFLDTQWNDLDYMNNSNDFTYDKENYDGLPRFVNELHERGMHYVPLVDPGVSAGEKLGSYPPYDVGIKMDIFVKNASGQPFIGKVWNSHSTVWPDFTHPTTVDYWTQMLKSFHNQVAFDGAWIDMNEPSNFLSGSFSGCPKSNLESPPYLPAVDGGVLNYKTMCMSAKHYAGLHYDVHNVYGLTEAIITSFALAEIRGKRPLVISRASFSGLGHYAGHWSGDVFSTWDGLKQSIPHLLSFSLYGIPLMGADICGFNGNTTVALCNRWQQLGAFYPFSRNHNTDDGIPQDPASMGDLVVTSTKNAYAVRYALLPYLYTLFFRAHVFGETVARPLYFEFYKDQETYGIDKEFLWGGGLLIVPVLEEGATSVLAYLPESIWYDYYSKYFIESKGEYTNLSAPLDTIPIFIRGGNILPAQQPKQTTTESRKTKIQLLVAPDANGEAFGELFWDDGDSLNTIEEKRYTLINFSLENGTLRSENGNWAEEYPPNLGSVIIMGIKQSVSQVDVNTASVPFKYDTVHKFLTIDNLNVSFEHPVVISWK